MVSFVFLMPVTLFAFAFLNVFFYLQQKRGLVNPRNICFINSCVQVLACVPELRNSLEDHKDAGICARGLWVTFQKLFECGEPFLCEEFLVSFRLFGSRLDLQICIPFFFCVVSFLYVSFTDFLYLHYFLYIF